MWNEKIFLDSSIEFIDTGNENLIPNDFLLPTQIDFINLQMIRIKLMIILIHN